MKEQLESLVHRALKQIARGGGLTVPAEFTFRIERTRDGRHGDFACNAALLLAAADSRKPRQIAEQIAAALPADELLERVEVAGPGFINFFLRREAWLRVVADVLLQSDRYGHSDAGGGERLLLEFVSANPTGPLHIGHGRGAAYGATLARLLAAAGWDVSTEYYVNDAGRQMDILAFSILMRHLETRGQNADFPAAAYRGEYVRAIAARVADVATALAEVSAADLYAGLDPDDDPDSRLDIMISRARKAVGEQTFEVIRKLGIDDILADIRDDLAGFGVEFDCWYSERTLVDDGRMQSCIDRLQAAGDIYEQDGALWFRSTRYGDEKDRVVVRENGQPTYFASDIAYHLDKFDRGFARAIDIWGADHHGHIARVKGALQALGRNPDALEVLLVQFATLYRGRERVQMSTRAGEFVTLRELRNEIGNDAARFFYVTRKSEQHLDFDLELAKSRSSDNPVYYIQYAHARICSVMRQMQEKGFTFDCGPALQHLAGLDQPHEQSLLGTLSKFPDLIADAARSRDPHLLAFYLRELANDFHAYYNSHQFLVDDEVLRNARVALVLAVRQVIRNGLAILGVSAPESM
jgi:arginyl-tRNA synthetase